MLKNHKVRGSLKDQSGVLLTVKNEVGKVVYFDSDVCLGFINGNQVPHLVKNYGARYLELRHNTIGNDRDSYHAPKQFKPSHGKVKDIKWRSWMKREVLDILSQSERWGKYFTPGNPDCVLVNTRTGVCFLRFDVNKHNYPLILMLYGWYRYINEARAYGYQLLKFYRKNLELPEKKRYTIDQLIMLSSIYYCPKKITGNVRLERNVQVGPGHITFSQDVHKNFFKVYDENEHKLLEYMPIVKGNADYARAGRLLDLDRGYDIIRTPAGLLSKGKPFYDPRAAK